MRATGGKRNHTNGTTARTTDGGTGLVTTLAMGGSALFCEKHSAGEDRHSYQRGKNQGGRGGRKDQRTSTKGEKSEENRKERQSRLGGSTDVGEGGAAQFFLLVLEGAPFFSRFILALLLFLIFIFISFRPSSRCPIIWCGFICCPLVHPLLLERLFAISCTPAARGSELALWRK